jgi:sensor histidine kinase YesM
MGFLCIAVSAIILIASFVKSDRRLILNRIFIGFIFCNIGIVSSDVVAWLMTERMSRHAFYLIRAANFLHYVFGALIFVALAHYMLTYIEFSVKVARGIKTIVFSLFALMLILTVISRFTGMYYTIDENNVYHRGELFLLSQILPVIGLFINIGTVFFYRKAFGRKASLFLLTYMILPITALCVQMLFFGITFINVATTLTVLILYIGVQSEREKNMSLRIMFVEQQLELQGEHYETLQKRTEDTIMVRHDLRHHLSVIKSYIRTGEAEKLSEYISEYESSLPDDTKTAFCANYAVNSILRHYIAIAQKEGVRIDVHLELPEKLGVSDSDLCIIFGNCVENAVEACRKIKTDEKFIKINAGQTGKMLAITIDNSFDGEINKNGDVFLSRKRDGEGIGISSVKAVAQRYGGETRFETKGNIFQASVMLQLKRD